MLVIPPMGAAADRRMDQTAQWWRDWSVQCSLEGEHRPMALRSALALKLLTYGLSGAVLAAATTSLPEAIGGGRNYDYRFCWLRETATSGSMPCRCNPATASPLAKPTSASPSSR